MQKHKLIDIKISTVIVILLILKETNLAKLEKTLLDMTDGIYDFFKNEFAILDIGTINHNNIDLDKFIKLFKKFHLNIVAIRNAPLELHDNICAHGLSIDSNLTQEIKTTQSLRHSLKTIKQKLALPVTPPKIPVMFIETPVRAGQLIYAKNCDLVITTTVNSGAEVIADGNIHVYAPLRGRALAGANGNTNARIFTTSLEAELVSIAGIYRTFDDSKDQLTQQQVQVRLIDNCINITQIK